MIDLFYSRVCPPPTIGRSVGKGLEPVFEEHDNCIVHVADNPMNIFVQESLSDTLIYEMIRKYQNGDINALERMTGQYFDATTLPGSLREAQQVMSSAESLYSRLPKQVKAKYPSVSAFVESAAKGDVAGLLSDLGFVKVTGKKPIAEKVESEVVAHES